MTQRVVRDLPEDVKQRLKRRAKLRGHCLEAEVWEILAQAPEPARTGVEAKTSWVFDLAERMRAIGVTNEDIDALNAAIAQGLLAGGDA